jgi:hypothetical protein
MDFKTRYASERYVQYLNCTGISKCTVNNNGRVPKVCNIQCINNEELVTIKCGETHAQSFAYCPSNWFVLSNKHCNS